MIYSEKVKTFVYLGVKGINDIHEFLDPLCFFGDWLFEWRSEGVWHFSVGFPFGLLPSVCCYAFQNIENPYLSALPPILGLKLCSEAVLIIKLFLIGATFMVWSEVSRHMAL